MTEPKQPTARPRKTSAQRAASSLKTVERVTRRLAEAGTVLPKGFPLPGELVEPGYWKVKANVDHALALARNANELAQCWPGAYADTRKAKQKPRAPRRDEWTDEKIRKALAAGPWRSRKNMDADRPAGRRLLRAAEAKKIPVTATLKTLFPEAYPPKPPKPLLKAPPLPPREKPRGRAKVPDNCWPFEGPAITPAQLYGADEFAAIMGTK